MRFKFIYPILLTFLLTLNVGASQSSLKINFQAGDIILQPLHCWLCNLIEAQTNSEYSHIAIVLIKDGKKMVAEAYGEVRYTDLTEFLNRTQKNKNLRLLRLDHSLFPENINEILQKTFEENYLGLSYDNKFLWDNSDEKGEMLYCSELLVKLLNKSFDLDIKPTPMYYDVNLELWERYFRAPAPHGLPGVTPQAFQYFSIYKDIGEFSADIAI